MSKRLGKGLDALFDDELPDENEKVIEIDIDKIKINNDQPRKFFNQDEIEALALSIKNYGLIQPLIVRKENDDYLLIAGERRLRACKIAGLKKVPCIVKNYEKVMEIALIENIQRQDLNPYEEALAFKKLIEQYGYTQEELSNKLGISRAKIANSIRILGIGDEIIKLIIDGKITEGHAKVLLSVDDNEKREKLAQMVVDQNLSVRSLEELIKKEKKNKAEDLVLKEVEENLMKLFGLKVKITKKNKKGKIEIQFSSEDELEKIISMIMP
ncbi:ParB/RepB/Spo0J family partition protein [Caldicellulosiruptoraceae bacterium PP1]